MRTIEQVYNTGANRCEKYCESGFSRKETIALMQEWATEDSKEFAKWLMNDTKGGAFQVEVNGGYYGRGLPGWTMDELYILFKKETT